MKKGMVIPKTYGRMGNFLFQAAAAMGYAWRNGLEFSLPNLTTNPKWNPIYLQHLVNPKFDSNLPSTQIDEKTHGYQELKFSHEYAMGRNVVLNGYWQTEKYFVEFRERVLEAFGFAWHHKARSCSVHVRRTDYLELERKHPPVPKEWYEAAMAQMKLRGLVDTFKFFSDDIAWCKQEFGRRQDVVFSEGQTETQDLVEMSSCEHHICSASTFSWWGAWLNRNHDKQVIIPKYWFQPGYNKTDTKDIVPETWEKL